MVVGNKGTIDGSDDDEDDMDPLPRVSIRAKEAAHAESSQARAA
jgi:hypothetical protein